MATSTLLASTLAACNQGLLGLGFRKRRGEVYTVDVTESAQGQIGLNHVLHRRAQVVEINAVVAIRVEQVEELVAKATNSPVHPYDPPTLSIHLGYLMPEEKYLPWTFGREDNIQELADQHVAEVADYALPFIRSNSRLEKVFELLSNGRFADVYSRTYRMPVVAVLLGSLETNRYIDEGLRTMSELGERSADEYSQFVQRLKKLINTS